MAKPEHDEEPVIEKDDVRGRANDEAEDVDDEFDEDDELDDSEEDTDEGTI